MKKINWETYKFRASSVKKLMTKSRSKTDPISQTTKSYLSEIWIKEIFGREKPITTPAMQKGTIVETDTMELFQKVTGKTYFKNNKQLDNNYVSGTPDIIDNKNKMIGDIKSSWDLWTFSKVNEDQAKKDYYYQLLTYMWLTGFKKSFLTYGLVNTPELMVYEEIHRLTFKMEEGKAEEYRKNFEFDDIDEKLRIKQYSFDFCDIEVAKVKAKIIYCREYLSNLSL